MANYPRLLICWCHPAECWQPSLSGWHDSWRWRYAHWVCVWIVVLMASPTTDRPMSTLNAAPFYSPFLLSFSLATVATTLAACLHNEKAHWTTAYTCSDNSCSDQLTWLNRFLVSIESSSAYLNGSPTNETKLLSSESSPANGDVINFSFQRQLAS